ncbi:MAG: c-type cytochrome [Gemmataceae bacterium]|nr:c-type cytochrome [Gemmataceae bacterium]MCI0741196.1 c-type cytochrome [Gemmataceae bacterium]
MVSRVAKVLFWICLYGADILVCLAGWKACPTSLLVCLPSTSARQAAIPAAQGFRLPDGFEITEFAGSDLANDIYCMSVDPKGRLVVSGRGYIRILLDDNQDGRADRALDFADNPKDGAMGILWEGPALYVTGDGGLRRFWDKDGDGRADGPAELLRKMKTGAEHAAHAIRRGPDGWLYVLCGNNTGIDASFAQLPTSPVREPIAGCVLRFTPDVKESEIVAHGFRNPYAMDFNADGELFTYDSDNERCVSLPWYEPTRFYQVVDGGFYGWLSPQRASSWRMPPYFVDVMPPLTYLGRGSPTGVACYRAGSFPREYRGGMFLADWTFGRVYYASLEKKGTSYVSEAKVFLESTGDNGFAPTALVVHPQTGDLYVSIGGRGTRGAVYRVRYKAGGPIAKDAPMPAKELDWTLGRQRQAVGQFASDDREQRWRALQFIRRFADRSADRTLQEAIEANWEDEDRLVHMSCVDLVRALRNRKGEEHIIALEKNAQTPRQKLTFHHALAATDPDHVLPALIPLLRDEEISEKTRLDLLRVVQIALGDIGDRKTLGTLWEGYSLRKDKLPIVLESNRLYERLIKAVEKEKFQSTHELWREGLRTLALLTPDVNYAYTDLERLPNPKLPADWIHHLAVYARLPGQRPDEEREAIAKGLLNLDRLAQEGKHNRDSHWPPRIAELYAGLAQKDPELSEVILQNKEFGRPDHALFAQARGFERGKAALVFLARLQKDADYALTENIVHLLEELPLEKTLPVVRKRIGHSGLDAVLLPLLARAPIPNDRGTFLAGLASPQANTMRVSLAALDRLSGQDDGDESLALIRALGNLPEKNGAQRQPLLDRLYKLTGQDFGSNKSAWTNWFAKQYPDKSAKLHNPDGVDVAAWEKRLAKLDWPQGDAARGKAVYVKASCVHCHSGNQALGPDLAGITGRFSKEDLFTALLQPSREVPPRYQNTLVETRDGKLYAGLVIYDAVDSLILQTGATATVRLPGEQVVTRRPSPLSLMPAGLLDRLDDRDIADLYAYLKSLRLSQNARQ